MHIAVSAEARNRANREFRAIATSNPFIPRLASPRLPSPSYLHRHRRSARLDFNFALILLNISRLHRPFPSTPLFSPFRLGVTTGVLPLFSSFPHARRQLYDATDCSSVYRDIIIRGKIRVGVSRCSIIAGDLTRFARKCTGTYFNFNNSSFFFFYSTTQ